MRAWLEKNLWECIAAAGTVALFVGLWLIYRPASLVVLGLELTVFGLWGARAWAKSDTHGRGDNGPPDQNL